MPLSEHSWFMGGGQNITINKGLEKVDSKPLMENVEGFKTSAMQRW